MTDRPDPAELYRLAAGDAARYRDLMVEYGYARRRSPDEPRPGPDDPILPCGLTRRTVESWQS